MDYPALLAQLEQQRAANVQEIADIDAIIAAVRKRATHQVPAGLTLPPVPPQPPSPKQNGRGKLTPEQIERMRKRYESGEVIDVIAASFKVSGPTVSNRAKAGGWKRPNVTKPTAAPTAKGTQLSGSVKCTSPECGVMTDYDPCRRCGTPLKRTWR